jgi:hypothetical protein
MYTDVLFVNRSLNTNVSAVGVFFGGDIGYSAPVDRQKTLLWRLIEHCGYDWRRPLRISWDATCALRSHDGNVVANKNLRLLLTQKKARIVARLTPSSRLTFCADLRLRPGEAVGAQDLNASLASFDLSGLRSMTIFMKGGQPGPNATCIKFVASEITLW